MVQEGCGYTVPWLDLDPDVVRAFAEGELNFTPWPLGEMTPRSILADVEGKDVLCLACGGGQQSAVFALLGARVTVIDLAQGQLEGDRRAAAHYGVDIRTIHGDMRDLSMLDDESFDLVYGTAICYVPDARQVYSEVARVLRSGGLYRTDWRQPALHFVAWDGEGYRITRPYSESGNPRNDGAIEFRHYMDDIFNGLIEVGLSIQQVEDISRAVLPNPQASPGSWDHERAYVGGEFVIVARKS
ncbi:MAG: class I SAM-dependent methyltransferase [Anaerolineae bacterium]|nr:class I SAM-dependent methyltransferase [Anaerolineae bacterium]